MASAPVVERRRARARRRRQPARSRRRSTSPPSASASMRALEPVRGARVASSSTGWSRRRPAACAGRLRDGTYHVVHYVGHSDFTEQGDGVLYLEDGRRHVGRGRRDAVRQPAVGPGHAAAGRAQLLRGRADDAHRSVRRRGDDARAPRRAGRRGDAVRDQRRRRDPLRRGAVHEPHRPPGPDRRRDRRGPQGDLRRGRHRRVGDAGAVRQRPGRRAVPLRGGGGTAAAARSARRPGRRAGRLDAARAGRWWRRSLAAVVVVLAVAALLLWCVRSATTNGRAASPRRPRRRTPPSPPSRACRSAARGRSWR